MNWITPYLAPLAGGLLIGLAAGGLQLFSGRIAGISGILRLGLRGPDRTWRLLFIAGLLGAGLAARLLADPAAITAGLAQMSGLRLVVAGLLVGIGTGLANGCTSGHGICGIARFSRSSFVAVLTFMGTAVLTVFVLRWSGWL